MIGADLPRDVTDFMAASAKPMRVDTFQIRFQHAAWHDKPSFGIVTTEDKVLSPYLFGRHPQGAIHLHVLVNPIDRPRGHVAPVAVALMNPAAHHVLLNAVKLRPQVAVVIGGALGP